MGNLGNTPSGQFAGSARSGGSPPSSRLRPGGGYRTLRNFGAATIIYDATVSFCGQLAAARPAHRSGQQCDTPAPSQCPACPTCGQPMVLRIARQGPKAGSQFWGCSTCPGCKATLPIA